MSDEAKRYNGWENFETWCVHLWLTNEEGSYRYWRDEARRHRKEAGKSHRVTRARWTVTEQASSTLGEQIRSELEEGCPIKGPSLYDDLMRAAVGEVNWEEVAEAFLEEIEPDDEPESEDVEADQGDDDDSEATSVEDIERVKRERIANPKGPLFELGRVVSTPGALAELGREDIEQALASHHRGDWGEVDQHDWKENEMSLKEGFRLLSVYRSASGVKFWVITEADRSSTCVLLPDEY
jgi:hypothetical protein